MEDCVRKGEALPCGKGAPKDGKPGGSSEEIAVCGLPVAPEMAMMISRGKSQGLHAMLAVWEAPRRACTPRGRRASKIPMHDAHPCKR